MEEGEISDLDKWAFGFFNGEGSIKERIFKDDTCNVGYGLGLETGVVATTPYIAGLIDAEGYVRESIYNDVSHNLNYGLGSSIEIEMNTSKDLDRFAKWLQINDIEYGRYDIVRNRENKVEGERLKVSSRSECRKALELLIPYLSFSKRIQAIIHLEKFIPMLNEGKHLDKLGFLECMSWIDLSREFKGARKAENTKYTLSYFEEKWSMELPEEKKAPSPEELLDGTYQKQKEERKEERKEAIQEASSAIPTQENEGLW